MDFVDGMDLLTMLEIEPERMADELIESLLRETLSALKYLHGTGMLHRDISPDNLLVDKSNKLTMIDFGAASEEKARKTRALSHMMAVKDGYSPHEFYYTDGDQRPSSDIYSVGATFYHLITGSAPPDCQKRVAALTSDMPDPYRPSPQATGRSTRPSCRPSTRLCPWHRKIVFSLRRNGWTVLNAPRQVTRSFPST